MGSEAVIHEQLKRFTRIAGKVQQRMGGPPSSHDEPPRPGPVDAACSPLGPDCITCQVVCKITRRVAPNQAYRPPRPRRPASAERGCMPPNPLTGREVDRSLIQSLFDWIQVRVSSASSMDTRTTPPALTPDAPDRPRSHGARRHSAHHLKTPRKVRQPKHCRRVDTIEHGGAYRTGDGPGLIHPRIRRRNPPQGRTGEASRKKRRGGLPMGSGRGGF